MGNAPNPFDGIGGSSGASTSSGGNPFDNIGGSSAGIPVSSGSSNGGGITGWLGRAVSSGAGDIIGAVPGAAKALEDFTVGAYNAGIGGITGNQAQFQQGRSQFMQPPDAIGNYYKSTYLPIFEHGDFGPLGHVLNTNPLQPILDVGSLFTGGAGAIAKVGDLADTLNLTDKLAGLNDAGKLSVPDYRGIAFKEGIEGNTPSEIALRDTAENPGVRARENAANWLMKKLPDQTPVMGTFGRVNRAIYSQAARITNMITLEGEPFREAFARLNKAERVAFHAIARGVSPSQWAEHIRGFAVKGWSVNGQALRLLDDEKANKLYDNPSPALLHTLELARPLSDLMTEQKVAGKAISPESAADRPNQLLRGVNGATVQEVGLDGKPILLSGTKDLPTSHALVDLPGREPEVLLKELQEAGHQLPFYIKDEPSFPIRNRIRSARSGFNPVRSKLGSSIQSKMALVNSGYVDLLNDPLYPEWARWRGLVRGKQIHDAILPHAAILPRGISIPKGWEFMRRTPGEKIGFMERMGAEIVRNAAERSVDKGLLPHGTADDHLATAADVEAANRAGQPLDLEEDEKGNRLIVPKSLRTYLESKSAISGATYDKALVKLLYTQPTSVWKAVILGLRPAFLANIAVGNSLLALMQSSGHLHSFSAWFKQVAPRIFDASGSRVTEETMRRSFPEQILGTFGRAAKYSSNANIRVMNRLYEGVMPWTIRYENVLRRTMVEDWARSNPEIKAEMAKNGGDLNQAIKDVGDRSPDVTASISKRVDDALGNYREYNVLEQKIKDLIPFYGWYRHIVRSAGRIVREHPIKAGLAAQLGTQGAPSVPLPSYLQSTIPIGGQNQNGQQQFLNLQGMNPGATLGDMINLLHGNTNSSLNQVESTFNPLLQAIINQAASTHPGKGGLLGGLYSSGKSVITGLPQIPLAEALLAKAGVGTPPGQHSKLYQNNLEGYLSSLLGAPIKTVNLPRAQQLNQQGQ